ncbi:hypothetical protein BJ138DRAFT_1003724 [Hygrophoropsis aurantiaca]|uniref:Uncharacterized protein n=1 Tax=Hygrophoropsis aurantiaca TaxID=72124 RepID=A0ACB8AHI1_9AGAM|nr:hypothetical protein BJ138DRAFT_1003724 [Hygrophoropsis aurantiaca]
MPRNGSENRDPASPPLSPKRSFAHDEDDFDVDIDPKRRHVHAEGANPKRSPLGQSSHSSIINTIDIVFLPPESLSASDLDNKPNRQPRWSKLVTQHLRGSVSVSDFQPLRVEQKQKSIGRSKGTDVNVSSDQTYSWPPPAGLDATAPPFQQIVYETSSAWPPSSSTSQRASGSSERHKSSGRSSSSAEHFTQPIRSRSNSLPFIYRPPDDLWRTVPLDNKPRRSLFVKVAEPLQTNKSPTVTEPDSVGYDMLPPGLPLPPHIQRRKTLDSGIGAASSSLASGSQPLGRVEQAKVMAPIGAERSRVVPMTLQKSRAASVPAPSSSTSNSDHTSSSLSSFTSSSTWSDTSARSPKQRPSNLYDQSTTLLFGDVWSSPGSLKAVRESRISKPDFNHLLLQAMTNKWATKVISPLSPLRYPIPDYKLTANRDYLIRTPSLANRPSARYYPSPLSNRSRSVCELYQPRDLEATCTHCQQCKRDTIRKKLLVSNHQSQPPKRKAWRGSSYDTPITLEEAPDDGEHGSEDTLWHELAVAASSELLPPTGFNEASGSPHVHDLHDFDEHDYPEIPDEESSSDGEVEDDKQKKIFV